MSSYAFRKERRRCLGREEVNEREVLVAAIQDFVREDLFDHWIFDDE